MSKQLEHDYRTEADIALVLAICSWLILGIILAPISIVLSARALGSSNTTTRIIATLALIVGFIALAVLLIAYLGTISYTIHR